MEHIFNFLKMADVPEKPRKSGVIEVRGPYYNMITVKHLEQMVEDWGEYFDGIKLPGYSAMLLSKDKVKHIIKVCHDHGIYVSTGGFVERVWVEGDRAVQKYFEEAHRLGYDVVEISRGLAKMTLDEKINLVERVLDLGMDPKPEVTMMEGTGAGTHVSGYKRVMRPVKDFFQEADAMIKAGAHMLMFESEGVTEDLPEKEWRIDLLKKVLGRYGYKRWMFEAADPVVFKWYLRNVARDANLFIDHTQVVEFNVWRYGLWGDKRIWEKNHRK
jgi:phosphosulfolactate synthase (CoM biosynthesis protein A)